MQVYEVTIGVPNLADAMRYYAAFGYEGGPSGRLTAEESKKLYRVDSPLASIRLRHQVADHGLVRLMEWEQPMSDGLGMAVMGVKGSRWTAQHTADLGRLEFHAAAAQSLNDGTFWRTELVGGAIQPQAAVRPRPFWDDMTGAREFFMVQPYFRQLFYSRYFRLLPNYGSINLNSRFRTSQITHVGMVLQGDDRVLDFYVDHFGMQRPIDPPLGPASSLPLYGLPDGASEWYLYWVQDQKSSSSDYGRSLSGRIIVLKFADHIPLPDLSGKSNTGHLGMSSYTFQVPDVADMEALHQSIGRSNATQVSPIALNELREPSFSFVAPDGYSWIVTGR